MLPFIAPQDDMLLSLTHIAGARRLYGQGAHGELSDDLVAALLSEAAKLTEAELSPTLRDSDLAPAALANRQVTCGPEMHALHAQVSAQGWIAMPFGEAAGGLNMPWSVTALTHELLNAANVAYALANCMTQGCAEAILTHASAELQAAYVPSLLDGTFMGTMHLTEASAGSDVGALKTTAREVGDGSWRIEGSKIYISWGDSDLAENVVHLVLARTPGGQAGTKGLSLFLVPKILPNGSRNAVYPAGLEHKLGIRGSPTCTMAHEGSIGWMVGDEFSGMSAMFTMMNNARIGVGFQGLGVAERALQAAKDHAANRTQGGNTINAYGDVQRMLCDMATQVQVSRDLGYSAHVAGDLAAMGGADAAAHQARADLLTPLAKAFMTDAAISVTNTAIQVFGGMGVIEEAGVAQLARDCRVFAIYEGTNGIQALDLLGRKIQRDQGTALLALLAEMRGTAEGAAEDDGIGAALIAGINALEAALPWLQTASLAPGGDGGKIAKPLLESLSRLFGCWTMLRRATHVEALADLAPAFREETKRLAAFYLQTHAPFLAIKFQELPALAKTIT